MKKQKKLLVIVIVFAIVAAFSVGTASAAWMVDATIENIQVSPDGNHVIKAVVGNWKKFFTIQSSSANANAILAVALTAFSNGNLITIDFTGATINNLYIK